MVGMSGRDETMRILILITVGVAAKVGGLEDRHGTNPDYVKSRMELSSVSRGPPGDHSCIA